MQQNLFQFNQNVQRFFDVHEEIWKKVQEFYYGDNPLNDALSKVNSEDMNLFFQALTKNPARLIEMQSKWWIGQMQIYQNIMLRSVNKDIQPLVKPEPGDPFQGYTLARTQLRSLDPVLSAFQSIGTRNAG